MSPTIAGSRPGGLIAGAWAAMVSVGLNGKQEFALLFVHLSSFHRFSFQLLTRNNLFKATWKAQEKSWKYLKRYRKGKGNIYNHKKILN